MQTSNRSTVVGAFASTSRAQDAIRALKNAGFREDQIGVVSPGGATTTGTTGATGLAGRVNDGGTHAAEGAVAGVAAGAGVGALWALGIAAGVLPIIGPIVAGGILASIAASAVGGAAIAGIVGALVGLGIPEEDANYYEGEFKSGRTIVTVKADGRYDEAWKILHSFDAYNRETSNVASR